MNINLLYLLTISFAIQSVGLNIIRAQTLNIKAVELNELSWNSQFAQPITEMGTLVISPLKLIHTQLVSEPFQGTRYWQIWMDLNGDGDYLDQYELVYQSGAINTDLHSANWTIPSEEYNKYGDGTRLKIDLAKTPLTMPGGGDDSGEVAAQRHDHFFVEIDDVISDDGLRQSIQQHNQANGCLLPNANGMIELPVDFEVNIWENSIGSSYNAAPAVEIQLTILEYATANPIDYYFFEPSETPIIYSAGSTVESISDFTLSNPLVSKTIGEEEYYKYKSDPMNPHTLRFPAQSPRVYELLATLVNYPQDGTIPLQTHTQSFKIVVGECICDNIPLSLNMPNPNPTPSSGDYARARTFVHAAGSAGDIDILAGSEQVYFGGTEIVLKDGFHAQNGSYFRTLLGDCDDYSSIYREALVEDKLSVEVFPNPNQGVFQLSYSLNALPQIPDYQVRIFDAQGRVVKAFREAAQTKGQLKVNLKDLADGIYWLQFSYGNEQIAKTIHKQ